MIGIGVDLVELDRFRLAMTRTPKITERCFTEAERAYALRKRDPVERFAARFAAKEAVMKAMGVGLWRFNFVDVEVMKAPSGAPSVRLHGKALALADALGVREWRLTLTHTERTAQAIAVAL